MGVLSREDIQSRLDLKVCEAGSLVITPLLNKDFDRDAVDVRLGSYFRLPDVTSIECIRPYCGGDKEAGIGHYPELVHRPYSHSKDREGKHETGSALILQPHHSVLASTLEYIKMPYDVSAEILTKSSWARVFISIASAPWIHPLYRGCLTLEITNLGNVPVALPVGQPIAHLVFMYVKGLGQSEGDIIEGKYAGAVMPEPPLFGG